MLRSTLQAALRARLAHRLRLPSALVTLTLGLGACAEVPTAPAVSAPPSVPSRLLVPTDGGYTDVEAGSYHTCALGTAGALACWGTNSSGQTTVPLAAQSVAQVSAGNQHTCAVSTAGAVVCWGDNYFGQRTVPLAAQSGIAQVSTGGQHTCALNTAGAVVCWGDNYYGQRVVPPAAQSGIVQLSAGRDYNCAVNTARAVVCWGDNTYGQTAVPAAAQSGIARVSSGAFHTCAVSTAGALVCWGDNSFDKLTVPAAFQSGIAQVSTGYQHTCAVSTAGALTCWGSNFFGETAVPAGSTTGIAQVSSGDYHACARSTVGALTCWGSNFRGEATAPPTTTRVLPTATFVAPAPVVAGQPFTLTLTDAQVPGYPAATAFTYAFDCGDGSGYAAATVTASRTCPTTVAGIRSVKAKVIDQSVDAAEYTGTVSITALAQAITFTSSVPSSAYVNDTYALVATGGASGNPVTFSSLTPATCTVSGATATFVTAGSCTLAADQASSATYAAAPQVTQLLTVTQRTQAITVTSALPTSAIVTSTFTLMATGGASGLPVVFASGTPSTCTTTGANGAMLTLTAAGACSITATQAGTAAYVAALPVTLTMTVLSPAQVTSALRALVGASSLSPTLGNSLTSKLDDALKALAAGKTKAACSALADFASQVQAQRGKAILDATADVWLAQTASIRTGAGC
ncbi:MAG: hypothetical protein V4617_01220 [Gemmatimonadota bacterium]